MSGRNLYERVRAAYGLDDDDVLRDLSADLPSRPIAGTSGGGRDSRHVFASGAGSVTPGSSRSAYLAGSPAASAASSWSIVDGDGHLHNGSYSQAYSYGYDMPHNADKSGFVAALPVVPPSYGQMSSCAPYPYHGQQAPFMNQAAVLQQPPPPPVEPTRLEKVNSVRVPFDPEDQSDDEVIITTAYNRKVRTGECTQQEQPQRTSCSGISRQQSDAKSKTLSPTAAPYQPKNDNGSTGVAAPSATDAASSTAQPAKPLVDIVGANGTPNNAAEVGLPYPGSRTGFCPWALVANYHLWFVGRQNSERIKPYFEEEALLQAQVWDFCYLWRPVEEDDKQQQAADKDKTPQEHVLLVPTSQFQHFMNRINQTLGIQLVIPPGPSGEKFRVFFGQQKTPIPRFLGHAASKSAFASMRENIPAFSPRDDAARLKPQAKNMYAQKVAGLLVRYDKNKIDQKNAKAEKLQLKRKLERQRVGRQIKRVQRYIGLRQKTSEGAQPLQLVALDLTQPPPYLPEDDVIFVSMDIESYEYNHSALTEIGFGILDTRDIAGVPPGAQCEQWFKLIQARHIRIREHVSMVNRHFVHGCEDSFNFGASEYVKADDVLAVITRILQPRLASGKPRKVVLLGHDIRSDISLVKNVGFFVKDGMFLEILDTQDIHQHFRMRRQQMGLRGVLNDLEIEHSFLHNGGNDAVYTLQAMIALVVKKRQESLRRQNEKLQPDFAMDAEVLAQGWASGGECSDGGYPEEGDESGKAAATEETGSGTSSPKHKRQKMGAVSDTSPSSSAPAVELPATLGTCGDGPPRLGQNLAALVQSDSCEDLISL